MKRFLFSWCSAACCLSASRFPLQCPQFRHRKARGLGGANEEDDKLTANQPGLSRPKSSRPSYAPPVSTSTIYNLGLMKVVQKVGGVVSDPSLAVRSSVGWVCVLGD